jgi:benzoylformate decarboxylase
MTTNQTSGASAFLSILEDEGLELLFGNPGTTELPIMNALGDHPRLRYVLGLQESIALAMADGFSRASGRLSACNVHVAPGLGNALGALYNAKWFGSPIIVTAGQHERGHGVTEPLLYDPLVPMAAPLVKWGYEVERFADLPRCLRRAAKVALTPPTGPVFLSLPGDILNEEGPLALGHPSRVEVESRPSDALLERLAARLVEARNPAIVSGHEVATGDALAEVAGLAELLGAPVYQQTAPYGAHFPSEHPAFMGALTRDQKQVRGVLERHDLLVCVGSDVLRMSVASPIDALPEGMPIVHLGLRDWEMGKNYPTELALRSDIKETLRSLHPLLERRLGPRGLARAKERLAGVARDNWSARRARLVESIERSATAEPIDPGVLMLRIVESLPSDAVVVEEALVSSRSLLGLLPLRDRASYFGLASGGIGFAVAGAIGIKLALPERPLVAIIGDGSAMYGIQALWTAAHLHLPIAYVIANNRGYRILRERLTAFHGSERFIGMTFEEPAIDFVGLARSMGVEAMRVADPDEIRPALAQAIAGPGPTLIDVAVATG